MGVIPRQQSVTNGISRHWSNAGKGSAASGSCPPHCQVTSQCPAPQVRCKNKSGEIESRLTPYRRDSRHLLCNEFPEQDTTLVGGKRLPAGSNFLGGGDELVQGSRSDKRDATQGVVRRCSGWPPAQALQGTQGRDWPRTLLGKLIQKCEP